MPRGSADVRRVDVANDLHLQVRVFGAPDPARSPVVLVHGFMGSAEAWGDLPERLARDRMVLVPDLPGHGGSAAPLRPEGYAVPAMARAAARAVSTVAPGPFDWVGYSMGGRIVLAGALEGALPVRRMVLESASPGLEDPAERALRRALDESRAVALERDGLDAFVDAWLRMPLFASQERLPLAVRERERTRRLVHDAAALAACLRGGGTGTQASYWSRLGESTAPTTLVTGGLDARFGEIADRMVRGLPVATHRRIPGAGHAVHLEAPDAWEAAVREALDGAGTPHATEPMR